MAANGTSSANGSWVSNLPRDLISSVVVFLVALPLCLGVALASGAPLFSGLLAGIVGGILVGALSGSHTSVSGPAAGLTAVVAAQIVSLGSFEVFLYALVIAGVIQLGLGVLRAGFIATFFPTSVIQGLLAAIGVIIILKQIPHFLGYDKDVVGNLSFQHVDVSAGPAAPTHGVQNTFTDLFDAFGNIAAGPFAIGLVSLAVIIVWDRIKPLKRSVIPSSLLVVGLGVALGRLFDHVDGWWEVETDHLVQVPVANSAGEFVSFFRFPDLSHWADYKVYVAGLTIAAVASLETLLNLEAVDRLDTQKRISPSNRELLAQGVGNVLCGLIGGLPVTSVVVRSSVNIQAGARSKMSAIFHGVLLVGCVMFLPRWLNYIPLSCLAAILIMTGYKLATPKLFVAMWKGGKAASVPFVVTLVAIVLSDLLVGVMIGLAVSLAFVLFSNFRRPLNKVVEKHLTGEVLRVELANQVSFLNRAALSETLDAVPRGGRILLDARNTDYIDPDVVVMIREFKEQIAPARGIELSLLGFQEQYEMTDQTQYVDYSTRDLQEAITPDQVLDILKDGYERFRSGQRLTRDNIRSITATADGQHPLAVIVSCIDSRTPSEIIFDMGMGDMFVVRIAGNITTPEVIGSVEYACAVAGAKLILVKGHTKCGAIAAAVDASDSHAHLGGSLDSLVKALEPTIRAVSADGKNGQAETHGEAFRTAVSYANVRNTADVLRTRSDIISKLVAEGKVKVVGAMYDVGSGKLEFLNFDDTPPAAA